ncbi:SAM-dependent methyltransferase [archaeon]|nr:SAM-dependent methyltransferase [archaeon]|tara:strand:- start:3327 stop:4175 length:849 start_codon:yes stop_codon:yes gene_type:complete
MIELKNLSEKDIESMDYNQLIGITKETNRPPGGIESVIHVANSIFLNKDSKVLEIGTSTGFTAIELSKLIQCKIKAIDVNEISLEEAKNRAQKEGINNVEFIKADATNLPFENEYFDLVFCGNVTSLISDRKKALDEYSRVLKKNGFIAAIPMYYVNEPSKDLLKNVSDAIKVDIKAQYKQEWIKFFNIPNLEYYRIYDYVFEKKSEDVINLFVDNIIKRPHLNELNVEARKMLNKKYKQYIHLFNENLSHMGFSIMLLRKKPEYDQDPELFTAVEAKNENH